MVSLPPKRSIQMITNSLDATLVLVSIFMVLCRNEVYRYVTQLLDVVAPGHAAVALGDLQPTPNEVVAEEPLREIDRIETPKKLR